MLGRISTPSNSIHILNGHYINLKETETDALIFESLLLELSKTFDFMLFEEACNKIKNLQSVSKPVISFTFDDGFKECYSIIAPLLEKFGTNACFFINPSVIEASDKYRLDFLGSKLKIENDKKFMTWAEIENLYRKGHVIGNHTMHHTALIGLTKEEAHQEVVSGKLALEKRLNYNCKYFALPYGNPSYFDEIGLNESLACHPFVFTSYQPSNYFYKNNVSVLERRHFEGSWTATSLNYFLKEKRKYAQ